MALNIVRHDITKIKADAIVNTTNEYFDVGGLGVDASIHYAAGPDLKDALSKSGTDRSAPLLLPGHSTFRPANTSFTRLLRYIKREM